MFVPLLVQADPLEIRGHVKVQVSHGERDSDAFAPDTATNYELDARLNAEYYESGWDLVAHGEVLSFAGDDLESARALRKASPYASSSSVVASDNRRLFRLTALANDSDFHESVVRLDRLSVGYTTDEVVVRAGRQAISWGNGVTFQVLDLFNPFSPTEIDKDYKIGDDLAYAQYLTSWGDDLQGLIVPRRDPQTDGVQANESSFAGKWHGRVEAFDYDLLASRHYGENVFGIGLSRGIGTALARVDVSVTETQDSGVRTSVIVNTDYSWMLFGLNMYGSLEYYRNGFGVSQSLYTQPPARVAERAARGELFALNRDYLAAGLQVEWAPLVNSYFNQIVNLHDESGIFQLRTLWEVKEYVTLTGGINIPFGPRGSEFGGIPLGNSDVLLQAPLELYGRVSFFF